MAHAVDSIKAQGPAGGTKVAKSWCCHACMQMNNPFNFKHITELKSTGHLDDVGACVVLATPSMLQARSPASMMEQTQCKVPGLAVQAGGCRALIAIFCRVDTAKGRPGSNIEAWQ